MCGHAQALGADQAVAVTFVAVTARLQQCQEAARAEGFRVFRVTKGVRAGVRRPWARTRRSR